MRFFISGLLLIGCGLVAGFPVFAQQSGAQQPGAAISAERRDIGRVETRIQRYDQALGVVSRLTRGLGAETECNGICYFPSSSRAVAWRCAPTQKCDLHCAVNPPVGGCD